MSPFSFRAFSLFIIMVSLFGLSCQSETEDEVVTLEQQLAGQWKLNSLDATIQLDGEDYAVYLAQLAESFDFSPEEVALGLLFLEARVAQEVMDRELQLNILADNSFIFQQAEADPLQGVWQLTENDKTIQLTSEVGEVLDLMLVSIDETAMTLRLEEQSDAPFILPDLPQQLTVQLEMDWITAAPDQE